MSIPYYDWSGHSIEEVLGNWKNKGLKLYDAYVHGNFPTEILWNHREYTRPIKEDLMESIKTHGFDRECPIIIAVSKTGKAWVTEGNHRLIIARELGIPKLPVRFIFYID